MQEVYPQEKHLANSAHQGNIDKKVRLTKDEILSAMVVYGFLSYFDVPGISKDGSAKNLPAKLLFGIIRKELRGNIKEEHSLAEGGYYGNIFEPWQTELPDGREF